jgi:guanine nucleotide-binding protein G(i) subunit alpha
MECCLSRHHRFVIGTSEFDQTMYEDSGTNRWHDTETLYEATVNSRWLQNSLLVIFLNKMDLFAAKIQKTKLSDWFSDYPVTDDHDFAAGTTYLLGRLTKLHRQVCLC